LHILGKKGRWWPDRAGAAITKTISAGHEIAAAAEIIAAFRHFHNCASSAPVTTIPFI
jgi:hypothetical protein